MSPLYGTLGISIILLMRAFANGTTALTGVEAISNDITAFRSPKSRNAGITLIWMSAILAACSWASRSWRTTSAPSRRNLKP